MLLYILGVFLSFFIALKEALKLCLKLILCPSQKKVKKQPAILSNILHSKFTYCNIKLNVYVLKNKFTFHKRYLFDLLFSRNFQSILQVILEQRTNF